MASRRRRLALLLALIIAAGAVILVLDHLDILPLWDDHPDGHFMPTFNGEPKVSPAEAEEYKEVLLEKIKDSEAISPLFKSTVTEIDFSDLGITPASVIADIGCGTGAFEFSLLERKVKFARIYAVDIDKRSLEFLDFALEAAKLEGWKKITTVLSQYDDVSLPAKSINIAMIHNTRFGMREGDAPLQGEKLKQRDRAMASLKRSLKPGGEVHVYEPTYTVVRETKPKFPEENVSEPFLAHGFKLLRKKRIRIDEEELYYMVFRVQE